MILLRETNLKTVKTTYYGTNNCKTRGNPDKDLHPDEDVIVLLSLYFLLVSKGSCIL